MPKPKQTKKPLPQAEEERLTIFEKKARENGYSRIVGIDEAGRGPLAGPVVAAACMIEEGLFFEGINDSKLLSLKKRLSLFSQLTHHKGVSWSYSTIEVEVIDEINIFQATRLAMKKAVEGLSFVPDALLIDALTLDFPTIFQEKIIHGDQLSQSIAAASILAKTIRDEIMLGWHKVYPQYGFDAHKGYATLQHRQALQTHGPSPLHRKSFLKTHFTHDDFMGF